MFFPNAQNTTIKNSNFTGIDAQYIFNQRVSGIDILLEAATPEAAFDSDARRYAPSCYPGTREQYIQDLTSWASTSYEGKPMIYWMKGPAGVGKSAIAQTCAEELQRMEQPELGAAFFFSVNGCSDDTRLFPILAYQLSTLFPDYRRILDTKIQNDKTLLKKRISRQFESLVISPLRDLEKQGSRIGKRTIIIDGLDECESEDAQSEILQIIGESVRDQTTPFCWAIFSRPNPCIEAAFSLISALIPCHIVWLPISRSVDQEIELYLKGGFANILRHRNMPTMLPWPDDEHIQNLWTLRMDYLPILPQCSASSTDSHIWIRWSLYARL
ncbi:hypothetical protein NP233_g5668 [Leucocoprinus birnbaumii]|uniref:Nephrocystin 3-like N-terminal domain-containing protein n=1 Tax=Leucocoprinus birnbaumii TaxID=56174 RepID=A0AAD5YRN5_9AGAR|nr:hypothetical protein NP233_g5668 [Leucocoprinus birnbaumii]